MSLLSPEQEKVCNKVIGMLKLVFPDEFVKAEFNLTPDKKTGKYKLITETFHTSN